MATTNADLAVRDLLVSSEARESVVGIVLAAVSLGIMLCSYLSAVLLVGLVLNATVGWWWADPVAAIGIAYLAVREGVEAWRGEDHHG